MPDRKPATEAWQLQSLEAAAFATLAWVDWFNTWQLLWAIGDIPSAEAEAPDCAILARAALLLLGADRYGGGF